MASGRKSNGAIVLYECASCEWRGGSDEMYDVDDVLLRILPGDTFPYGQCPITDCQAFCYIVED